MLRMVLQVHQVKKIHKWICARCGQKQSVQQVKFTLVMVCCSGMLRLALQTGMAW